MPVTPHVIRLVSVSTEVRDHIPSADLREFLKLFAPTECYTRVKACEACGGTIDIVHHEVRWTCLPPPHVLRCI